MNGNKSTSVRNLHLNLGEVFYLIAKRHGAAPAERFLSDLPMMPIQAVVPDRKLILDAARLKSRFPFPTRTHLQWKRRGSKRPRW